jgi:hypothetical protein
MKGISSSDNRFSLLLKASRVLAASLPMVFLPGGPILCVLWLPHVINWSKVAGGGNTEAPSPSWAIQIWAYLYNLSVATLVKRIPSNNTVFINTHASLLSYVRMYPDRSYGLFLTCGKKLGLIKHSTNYTGYILQLSFLIGNKDLYILERLSNISTAANKSILASI